MTATATTLMMTRGEEAMAMIKIMTTITRTKAGGDCKGTAHPGVGTTYSTCKYEVIFNDNISVGNGGDDDNVDGGMWGARIIRAASPCSVIIAAVCVLVVSLLPMPRGTTITSIITQKQWR